MTLWSDETIARAQEIVARYPRRRSAVMPLLYMAMGEEGHLSDEGMAQVASLVGLTAAQVRSVASFYTMYKQPPLGRYLVSTCTSISCMLLGADQVLEAVEEEAGVPDGETTDDGLITVEHVECIGACGGAPAIQVNYELIEGVDSAKARGLIQWLRSARPEVVNTDEMQGLFGSRTSFDWAIKEEVGARGPYPAFSPYGSEGRE